MVVEMAIKLVVIFGLLATLVCGSELESDSPRDYSQHRVVRIRPASLKHVEHLRQLEKDFNMDFWNEPFDDMRPVLTLVEQSQDFFLTTLNRSSIQYEIVAQNFQTVIERERTMMNMDRALRATRPRAFNYETYHTYDEIIAHVKELAQNNAGKATYINVGTTYEKREIPGIKIGNSGQVIFLECGIHSREWVTTAFCTWLINQLLTDPATAAYTEKYQFIVVPSLNVDGYVYTHKTDRMWRKTRTQQSGTTCRGADPNRNWDSSFCLKGASSNPCSETYCGKSAFSEPCALAMAKLAEKYQGNILAYFAVHSYSQLWMYPFGYKYDKPSNNAQLASLSSKAVSAIKAVNNKSFKYGTIASTIYLASGSSADYVYDALGVKNSFALELRDTGDYGFILPANQILPASKETWAGIKAAIDVM